MWELNIAAIIHIYEARANFILFCDHPDTECKSCEIEMSISQPIFTHNNISKAIWDNDIHTIQYRRKYCGSSLYLWSFRQFFDYFVINKLPSLSHEKYKLV